MVGYGERGVQREGGGTEVEAVGERGGRRERELGGRCEEEGGDGESGHFSLSLRGERMEERKVFEYMGE